MSKLTSKQSKFNQNTFPSFSPGIVTVFCICRAIFLVLAHLMKIYSIDYYIWYECSSKKKKGCCSKNTYYKIMTTNKQILSLQIAPPNITSNETQAGMYSVAGLWTLMLLSIIFTSVHEDALFKTFLSQHALWDTDQFFVSRDLIALWRVRVFQMEQAHVCVCVCKVCLHIFQQFHVVNQTWEHMGNALLNRLNR